MIDSIDNNMAAPSGEADFSGAVSPEAEALTEAAAQAVPLPSLLGEDGGFVPDWYARFDELKGMEKSLSKFKTPEALAKSYAELERLRHYPGVENEITAWNVRSPRRKASGMQGSQNAWPARPTVTVYLRKP